MLAAEARAEGEKRKAVIYVTVWREVAARGRVTVHLMNFPSSSGTSTGPAAIVRSAPGEVASWRAGWGEPDRRFLHNLEGALR
jgi:hypothetical protein